MELSRRNFLAAGLGIACSAKGEVLDALAKVVNPVATPVGVMTSSVFLPSISIISGWISISGWAPGMGMPCPWDPPRQKSIEFTPMSTLSFMHQASGCYRFEKGE